ncbi:MAG: hypothetical protein RQ826_09025 [Xanthomonadales bacterium]|nr:hypothetical protein [Xanthomonadales bacterium]
MKTLASDWRVTLIESLLKAIGLSLLLVSAAAAALAQEPTGTGDGEAPRQEAVQQDQDADETAPELSAEEGSEKVEAADRFEPTEQIDEDYSIDFPVDI